MPIFAAEVTNNWKRYDRNTFLGAAYDTGAQRVVLGAYQPQAYRSREQTWFSVLLARSNSTFADIFSHRLRKMVSILPTPSEQKKIFAHVVPVAIPLVVGLDTLNYYAWNFQAVQIGFKEFEKKPIHIYIAGNVMFCFDGQEIFLHCILDRSYQNESRFHPSCCIKTSLGSSSCLSMKDKGDTPETINDITRSYHVCQTYSIGPISLSVRFPDEEIFKKRTMMDLMCLNGSPVL